MTDGLGPYPVYKDSGVSWIGEVPKHWRISPVKRSYSIQLGKMLQNGPKGPADVEVPYLKAQHVQWFSVRTSALKRMWASPADLVRFGIANGDLLVCEGGEGGRSGIVREISPGHIIQNALHRVRPSGEHTNEFLQYAMSGVSASGWFDAINNKATIAHFTHEKFGALYIPLPSVEEEIAIVRYLDHVDHNINRYIRAKKKLIGLLHEQKQAIIHRAVTCGLDPDVKLKRSGVEWLGDVPSHWEVTRIGRVMHLTTGFPFKSTGFSEGENDTRLLRGINVAPGSVRWEQTVRWPASERDELTEYELREDDIVLGMDRPIIRTGVRVAKIGPSDVPSLLLQRVARIRASDRINGDFLFLLLGGKSFCDYLAPIFTGISVPHISPEQINSFRIVLPSLEEQARIISKIEKMTKAISLSIAVADREIDLLREYRTRLVADVVTGKLDVRAAAAKLPDLTPEAAPLDELDDVLQDESVAEVEMDEVAEAA